MSDLSSCADEAFDLVYSGQSIEHVPEREADHVLREVRRVFRPGGYFAFDTPSARIRGCNKAEFIDPDHDVEYTAAELDGKLRAADFEVVERKGLNYVGAAAARGTFDWNEAARNRGVFSEAGDCYLLAYLLPQARLKRWRDREAARGRGGRVGGSGEQQDRRRRAAPEPDQNTRALATSQRENKVGRVGFEPT